MEQKNPLFTGIFIGTHILNDSIFPKLGRIQK